jgi:D-alanyl-D-alanine carboxypeptidase
MRRVISSVLVLAAWALAGQGRAQDYRPVTCSAPAAYAGPEVFTSGPAQLPPVAAAPPAAGPVDAATQDRLDEALDMAMARSGALAISAAVIGPDGRVWEGRRGAQVRPLAAWASAGKTVTAIAILQLAEAGRLSLDAPVATWVEGVPNGEVVTVRHLLEHTSGLFSANEDRVFRRNPRILTLDEELAIVRRHGAMFCPGAAWRYSNSNYALLGAILERVEGRPYAEVVKSRVFDPLGLSDMRVATARDALDDVTAAGPPGPDDIPWDPRRAGPAGGVVAPALEMAMLWRGLLDGRLIGRDSLREAFARMYPMFGRPESYGLGVMAYRLPDRLLLGHSGGGGGLTAVVLHDPETRAYVAVSVSGERGAEVTANLLLSRLAAPAP